VDFLDSFDLGWRRRRLLKAPRSLPRGGRYAMAGFGLLLVASCGVGAEVEQTGDATPTQTQRSVAIHPDLAEEVNRVAAAGIAGRRDEFVAGFTDACRKVLSENSTWFESTQDMNRSLGTGDIPVSSVVGESKERTGWEVRTWYTSRFEAPSGTSSVGGRETTIWERTPEGWRRSDCQIVLQAAERSRNLRTPGSASAGEGQ